MTGTAMASDRTGREEGSIQAAPIAGSFVSGELLVRYKDGISGEQLSIFHAANRVSPSGRTRYANVERLRLPPDISVESAIALYQRRPEVDSVEPNFLRAASRAPLDPNFDRQWSLHNTGQSLKGTFPPISVSIGADIDGPEAWNIQTTAENILIAVIDSGIDGTHIDLTGSVQSSIGWNFVGSQFCTMDSEGLCHCDSDDPTGNDDPTDDMGHGTATAGIVGAVGGNQVGIAGVAWRAKLLPLKALGRSGCGSVGDEIQAIEYAIEQGARVILISSAGGDSSAAELAALQAARDAGILVIAPAGNKGSNNDSRPVFPAGYDLPNLISVAASDSRDQLAFFSNYGRNSVDLAAPGDCVYSTMPTKFFAMENDTNFLCTSFKFSRDYDYNAGSSYAAAHVAGAAALLLERDPTLTPDQVRSILLTSVDPNPLLLERTLSGGRLNLHRALLRESASTFAGGAGGGGGCATIAPTDGDSRSDGEAAAFILSLFLPVLLLLRRLRRPGGAGKGPLVVTRIVIVCVLILFLPRISLGQAPADEDEPRGTDVESPHSASVKVGAHGYLSSDYIDSNEVYFDERDLIGGAIELEYNYQYHIGSRFAMAAGYYEGRDRFENLCCSRIDLSTYYLLATVKFDFKFELGGKSPVRLFLGPGIGSYWFHRTVEVLGKRDRFTERPYGLHFVVGADLPISRNLNVLVESRYASAVIDSANELNDQFDIGGITAFLGLTWNFAQPPADPSGEES